MNPIRDRVKSLRRVKASDLVPHELNWRTHPQAQKDAISGILEEVGFAGAILARELPDGRLGVIDGHLRRDILPDQKVPVLVLDVDEAEAKKLLATFDPIGAMAEGNTETLDALLREVDTGSTALQEMLAKLAEGQDMFDVNESDAPDLNDGDRAPFQQMTFTVHDTQSAIINTAIKKAKAAGPFDGSPNENSNGNALARIAGAYNGQG